MLYTAACQEDRSRWLWWAYCGVKSDLNSDHFTELTAPLVTMAETLSGTGFNDIIWILSDLSLTVKRFCGLNKRLSLNPWTGLPFSASNGVEQTSEILTIRVSLSQKTMETHWEIKPENEYTFLYNVCFVHSKGTCIGNIKTIVSRKVGYNAFFHWPIGNMDWSIKAAHG